MVKCHLYVQKQTSKKPQPNPCRLNVNPLDNENFILNVFQNSSDVLSGRPCSNWKLVIVCTFLYIYIYIYIKKKTKRITNKKQKKKSSWSAKELFKEKERWNGGQIYTTIILKAVIKWRKYHAPESKCEQNSVTKGTPKTEKVGSWRGMEGLDE